LLWKDRCQTPGFLEKTLTAGPQQDPIIMTGNDLQLQRFFHLFTDSREEPHFLVNLTGELFAANPAACKMLGRSQEDLCHHHLSAIIDSPESIPKCLRNWARTASPLPEPLTWIGETGTRFPTFAHGSLLKFDTTTPPHLLIYATPEVSASARSMTATKALAEIYSSFNGAAQSFQELPPKNGKQRQVETASEESHRLLLSILDTIEAVVYAADMQTYEILFINRHGRQLVGDVKGKICWQNMQAGQQGPCTFCTNKHLLTPEGTPGKAWARDFENTFSGRWYHIINLAIPWRDGRIVRLEIATDITASKQHDLSPKTDEERLEALWRLNQLEFKSEQDFIDQALEKAVKLTTSEGGYLHLFKDQNTVEHFSWSKKVNLKCSAKRLTHHPLSDAGIWADSARQRQPVIHNDYLQEPAKNGLPAGHFPLVRHMSVPIVDEGRIVAIAGVGNKKTPYDQTDVRQLSLFVNNLWRILKQKRTELEVLRAKEEWESTFDAIDEVVTIHDQEMRIIRANKATGRLFNIAPSELVGRYCYEVVRNASEPCAGCPELLSRADLQPHQAIIRHDNLKKTFHVSSSPLIDDKGTVKGFIHLAKDVTRQRVLENKLQQTQKMEAIGVLAGGIAHDFNNILSPIIGYTDLALNHLPSANRVTTYLQQVNKAANRARELVQQILTFGRQAVQEKKPLQLHLVINEALKLLRATLPTTIEIRQHIPDCGAVLADPIQIHQIVMNLTTNAAHAMRETGGVLEITLGRVDIARDDPQVASLELTPGSYVMLAVSDTGHGMSREILERIFEPYFSTKQTGEGTGLGLAVVHGIVESYGGHITASSEKGQGTLFQIYLPRMEGEFHPVEPPLTKPLPRGSESILIVDDEAIIVPMLREMLEGLGYRVTISNDSIDTWEIFQKKPDAFDLLITDMAMPGLTGFDLAKKVLAIRQQMPIILCTGFSEVMDREKARAAGIGAFLVKPVTMRELAETVRKVLDDKR
jgi:PAS domain S-box-containing protein